MKESRLIYRQIYRLTRQLVSGRSPCNGEDLPNPKMVPNMSRDCRPQRLKGKELLAFKSEQNEMPGN